MQNYVPKDKQVISLELQKIIEDFDEDAITCQSQRRGNLSQPTARLRMESRKFSTSSLISQDSKYRTYQRDKKAASSFFRSRSLKKCQPSILIVDDNLFNITALEAIIESLFSVKCLTASNGEIAVQTVNN